MGVGQNHKEFFQRVVAAGLMVTDSEFMMLFGADKTNTAAIEASVTRYGLSPAIFKKKGKGRILDLTVAQSDALSVVNELIVELLFEGAYDPPPCPDERFGAALVASSVALDKTFPKAKAPIVPKTVVKKAVASKKKEGK